MNPPRWSTRYSDDVRGALVQLVAEGQAEKQPAPCHRRRTGIRLAVAIVIALLLVVPASITALVLADHAGPAGSAPTVVLPTTPMPAPTVTTARPASAGCAPTIGQGIPAGADRGVIDDVDGDHRPDTEWASLVSGTVEFGITTASGATVSGRAQFAGGGDRTFVVGHLANGVVVVIPSEGRSSDLLTFGGCALHQTEGRNPDLPSVGNSFTLFSQGGGGDATCLGGELYAVSFTSDGGAFENVIGQRVQVSADGMKASLSTRKRTLATHVGTSTSNRYRGVSCGTAPVLRPKQGD